jgi:hypothetical protein
MLFRARAPAVRFRASEAGRPRFSEPRLSSDQEDRIEWLTYVPRARENIRVADVRARDTRSTQAKVMDVHPSRTAAIRSHRIAAHNNQSFARGHRAGRAEAFLD